MVMMTVKSLTNLQCEAVHGPSGAIIQTDAPKDVGGNASQFSPTDLATVSLLNCILTTMGLAANKIGVDLTGSTGTISKEMTQTPPRRIAKITVAVNVPLNPDAETRAKLEHAANNCPVHHSLHPDIIQDIKIHWAG